MKQSKTLWPIEKLDLWKRNPRKMEDVDKARLKAQLLDLEQYKPLLVVPEGDRGTVLGGNMRLTCMRELVKEGHTQFASVWVSLVEAPDDKTKLKYALSDNDSVGTVNGAELFDMVAEIPDFDQDAYNVDSGRGMSVAEIVERYSNKQEPQKYNSNSISFTCSDKEEEFVRSCIALAQEASDFEKVGNRPRLVDALMYIVKEWAESKK